MQINTSDIQVNDVTIAASLHANRSKVGLHSILGSNFLREFYQGIINNDDLKVLVAKIDQQVVGVGYLVINQNYLRNIVLRTPVKFFLMVLLQIPKLILSPFRTFGAVRAVLTGGGSGATVKPPPDSVELGFIVTDQVKSIPASAISKAIYTDLKEYAKNHGYKNIFSIVSAGHHSSILMHSILGFKKYGSNERFIYYLQSLSSAND